MIVCCGRARYVESRTLPIPGSVSWLLLSVVNLWEEGTHTMLLTPVGTRNQDYRLFCHFGIVFPMGLYFRFGYRGIPQLSPVVTDGRLIGL